jgi:hypothetical protein
VQTRKLVLSLAAVLVLALVAPVVGQPFADVPTNHWAYDAIAELAAKGLVEGFPDGTFKGNQPMTRYEMAMIVARIIARIEAIPTPPPPEVRRADLDAVRRDLTAATGRIAASERTIATLQRLVNEFRAELQALGVRVTALEEELSALRARLDNTRITGDFTWWYTSFGGALSSPPQQSLSRIRLTYSGRIADNVTVTLRARNQYQSVVPGGPFIGHSAVDFDRLYLDWSGALGVEGLSLRIGRQTAELGAIGLLLGEETNNDRRDGVSLRWSLGPVRILALAQWRDLAVPPSTDNFILAGRLTFDLVPGWTLGINVRNDQSPWSGAARGTGFSGDLTADLLAGLRLTAEYATFDTTGVGSRNWWEARLDLNFAQLTGTEMAWNPRLRVFYRDFDDTTGTPLDPSVLAGNFVLTDAYFGDFVGVLLNGVRGWGARVDLELTTELALALTYERYDSKLVPVSGSVWSGQLAWTIAPRTVLTFFYASGEITGVAQGQAGGVYLVTSW